MCLFFHWYGEWQPTKETRLVGYEPQYFQGQVVHHLPKYMRVERRVCHFCPKTQEREVEDLRLPRVDNG